MQWMQYGVSVLVAAGTLAATAPYARGQGNVYDPNAILPDTLATTSAGGYNFSPLFKNNIGGGVSFVNMKNDFSTSMTTPFGPILSFGLLKDEKHYRLQAQSEQTKKLSLTGFYMIRPGLTSTLGYVNSRVFNRSVFPGGSYRDYIFNDNGFTGGLNYLRSFGRLRVDGAATGLAMNGERSYKTDQTFGGGINGGAAYNLGSRVVLQARGALRETSETSRTTLTVFDGLGASEDSISGVVRVSLADSVQVTASYLSFNGVHDYADQAQGSLGGQLGGAENVVEEAETLMTRSTAITMNSQPWSNLAFTMDASHSEQSAHYMTQTTRFSENTVDQVKGMVSYLMPWQTQAAANFENTETLRNFGPQSVASYNEIRKRVGLSFSQQLTKTMAVNLAGSTQLTQSFYLDYDANPRDRDQVDNIAQLRITSTTFKNVLTTISLSYSSTQYINIDASQSRNNRTRQLFELRPQYTWTVRNWLTISQQYGVVIEYTDYVFFPNENYLDRNLVFVNQFGFKPTRDISFRFDYQLYLHDKGSYLPQGPNGQDVLNVDRKDHRNNLLLRLDYDINDRLKMFAEDRYSQFVDETVSTGFQNVTTNGQLTVGAAGNYAWKKNRTLMFSLARVKRFSPTGAPKEKDYWEMTSQLNFPL